MIVCVCNALSDKQIINTVNQNKIEKKLTSQQFLKTYCGCSHKCGKCSKFIKENYLQR